MSTVYAVQIDTEHTDIEFDHEMCGILRGKNLKPTVEELWSVGSEKHGGDDSGYILGVVSHWKDDFRYVDAQEDSPAETLVCGCTDYYFRCLDRDLGAKVDDCKHCQRVKKQRRTELSEQQATLGTD